MLNILVACKEPKEPGGLEHAGEHRVLYDTSKGWAAASNNLLAQAAEFGGDALFIDDDTCLTKGCLDGVREHYDRAELFGLDLHDMSGARQAGARHILDYQGGLHDWVQPGPAYVAHCSTSAMYIKAKALQSVHSDVRHPIAQPLRFPIWDGIHWEDVAFCLDAWLRGLRVLAVPGYVHHDIVGGVGAVKRHTPEFWDKWAKNLHAFGAWASEHELMRAIADGRVPVGVREL